MAVERTYYCDAPDCEHNATTAADPPYLPGGMLRVEQQDSEGRSEFHLCSWDCVMKLAAAREPTEVIPWQAEQGGKR